MIDTDDGDRGAVGYVAVVVAVLVVLGTALAGAAVTNLTAPSGEAILDTTEQRYESAETVVGTATVTVTNDSVTRTYDVSYAVTDDNESRVTVTGDDGTVVAGTNGSVAWVHDPETGVTRVIDNESDAGNNDRSGTPWGDKRSELNESRNESIERAGERLRGFAWDWTDENSTAERVGQTTIDGTKAWIVELSSTNASREGTIRYWIATDDSTVLKQRYTDGDRTVTVRYTETRFGVGVSDATFQPPGVTTQSLQRVESFDALQRKTSLTVPALDADGYTFETGSISEYGGETAIAQYTGAANVTIAVSTAQDLPFDTDNVSTVSVGGVTANVTTTERGTTVVWQESGVTVAVVTDADRDTAVALAESLVGTASDGETTDDEQARLTTTRIA